MNSIILVFTKHAKFKMIELGISKEQIKLVIQRGSKSKQTDGYLASFTYVKVAYKKINKDTYKIKTVYISTGY